MHKWTNKKYNWGQQILVYLRKKIPVTDVIILWSTVDRMWAEHFYGLTEWKRSIKIKKTVIVFCIGIVSSVLGNCPTWRTNSFQCIYLFIVLYVFWACHAHHQEKQIVSIQLLVIVTPCWWQCRVLVGSLLLIYITRLASNELFSPSNKIHSEVGRAKDLSAPPHPHPPCVCVCVWRGGAFMWFFMIYL